MVNCMITAWCSNPVAVAMAVCGWCKARVGVVLTKVVYCFASLDSNLIEVECIGDAKWMNANIENVARK